MPWQSIRDYVPRVRFGNSLEHFSGCCITNSDVVILSEAKDLLFSWACNPLRKKQILRSPASRGPQNDNIMGKMAHHTNTENALGMAAPTIRIRACPTCGSTRIKLVRRKWTGQYDGKSYSVPSVQFYECPNCGERIYDREAMRKIEAISPAFAKIPSRKKSA